MDKFLETCNQTESLKIKNINRPIISKDIESVIKNLPTKDQMAYWKILENILKSSRTNPPQTFPPKCRGENTSTHFMRPTLP